MGLQVDATAVLEEAIKVSETPQEVERHLSVSLMVLVTEPGLPSPPVDARPQWWLFDTGKEGEALCWRCDLEAGMAKLLAARVAWGAADNALQIHGGNGFALEFPVSRALCDARILNIFEGAAEIQAQVIARRLLDRNVN